MSALKGNLGTFGDCVSPKLYSADLKVFTLLLFLYYAVRQKRFESKNIDTASKKSFIATKINTFFTCIFLFYTNIL